MAIKTIDDTNLTAIANSIRAKGVEGTWKPSQMAAAIDSIQAGGGDATFTPEEMTMSSRNTFHLVSGSGGSNKADIYHYLFSGNTIREITSNIYIELRQTTNVSYGLRQIAVGWKNDDGTVTYYQGLNKTGESGIVSTTIDPKSFSEEGLDKNLVIAVVHNGATDDIAFVTWDSPDTPTIAERWYTDNGGGGHYYPSDSLETEQIITSVTQGMLEITYNSAPQTLYTVEGGSF